MTAGDGGQPATSGSEERAVNHMREAIASGRHWYLALLEAMRLWQAATEDWQGRRCCYLIDDEAFDWLLLAERLCTTADGLIREEESLEFLFTAEPPLELTQEEFRRLIGEDKCRAYLNYLYGVTVEEALLLAVEEEVRKEAASVLRRPGEDAYQRLYGASQDALLGLFRSEKGYPQRQESDLQEMKEFTYWLFKRRLQRGPGARVASDTRKALNFLAQQWASVQRCSRARREARLATVLDL